MVYSAAREHGRFPAPQCQPRRGQSSEHRAAADGRDVGTVPSYPLHLRLQVLAQVIQYFKRWYSLHFAALISEKPIPCLCRFG